MFFFFKQHPFVYILRSILRIHLTVVGVHVNISPFKYDSNQNIIGGVV